MIPIVSLEVDIQADYDIDLGANPGSSVRGALYQALRTMYDNYEPVTSRHESEINPVAWLLRMEDEQASGGRDVPRPLAIRPPLKNPAKTMTIGLAVYGQAHRYINMILSALQAMQQIGMGRGRHPFSITAIRTLDPLSRQETLICNDQGQIINHLPEVATASAYENFAAILNPNQLTLSFHTPTRIIQKKALVHKPLFKPIMQRLLERIYTISEVYTDKPLNFRFSDLLDDASTVHIVDDQTRWLESWSGSRYDGMMKPTSGFVGDVTYAGNLQHLLPYLLIGQSLQVGKNTIKGCGWYTVRYDWRTS